MNPRTSLTLTGIIVILMGIIPLAAKMVNLPILQAIPEAGSVVYQSVLIVIGILALFLSGKKKQKQMPKYIEVK